MGRMTMVFVYVSVRVSERGIATKILNIKYDMASACSAGFSMMCGVRIDTLISDPPVIRLFVKYLTLLTVHSSNGVVAMNQL